MQLCRFAGLICIVCGCIWYNSLLTWKNMIWKACWKWSHITSNPLPQITCETQHLLKMIRIFSKAGLFNQTILKPSKSYHPSLPAYQVAPEQLQLHLDFQPPQPPPSSAPVASVPVGKPPADGPDRGRGHWFVGTLKKSRRPAIFGVGMKRKSTKRIGDLISNKKKCLTSLCLYLNASDRSSVNGLVKLLILLHQMHVALLLFRNLWHCLIFLMPESTRCCYDEQIIDPHSGGLAHTWTQLSHFLKKKSCRNVSIP